MNQRIQKQNIREKYWRYSLYVILLGLGTVIFVELIPFLGGLLGALTIYVLLRGQMRALTIRHKLRRSLAASLLIGEAIVCFLIPLSLLVWLLVAKLQDVTLDPSTVIQPIRNLAELIRERIGYNLLDWWSCCLGPGSGYCRASAALRSMWWCCCSFSILC